MFVLEEGVVQIIPETIHGSTSNLKVSPTDSLRELNALEVEITLSDQSHEQSELVVDVILCP